MMNSKGQVWAVLLFVGFLFMIALFATIEPLKESLNVIRGGDNLNCLDTSDFNQTAYNNQSRLEQLAKRPTCFATGLTMVWFLLSFMFATAIWIVDNVRKSIKK